MKPQIPAHVTAISPYSPGKPIEELEREYGVSGSIKLASNENPLGPSPLAVAAIRSSLGDLHRYPDGSSHHLSAALSRHLGVDPARIVFGNGSNEIIELLVTVFVGPGDEVISSYPSFLMYQKFVQTRGGVNSVIPLDDMHHDLERIASLTTAGTRLVFLDNPNNPTGSLIPAARLDAFLAGLPEHVIVVLDEAYVDFVEPPDAYETAGLIEDTPGRCAVVCVRTFSKAYGLAGLRIGYGLMHESIAASLHKVRQPFNVNLPAQAGAAAALEDRDFHRRTLQLVADGKRWLAGEVTRLGCTAYPSHTNFFLIDVGGDADALYEAMLRRGVIVRSMTSYGLPTFIRINVGTDAENRRFVEALEATLREDRHA